MKKLIATAAFLALAACQGPGLTAKPMALEPAVAGIAFGVTACAMTGACVMP